VEGGSGWETGRKAGKKALGGRRGKESNRAQNFRESAKKGRIWRVELSCILLVDRKFAILGDN